MTFAQQGASVGDLPGFGEEAYFHEEATYAPSSYVGDGAAPASYVGDVAVPNQSPRFRPVGFSQMQPAADRGGAELRTVAAQSSACDAPGAGFGFGVGDLDPCNDCNGNCTDPCDTCNNGRGWFGLGKWDLGSCLRFDNCNPRLGRGKNLTRVFDQFDNCTWASAEFLTWWSGDRNSPALVTTSNPGTTPVLPQGGANNVAVVWGDPIDGEITGGFRGDLGRMVARNVGIGGRLWVVADSNDSFFASGDGTSGSIGRPFFNINTGTEDALLVAFDPTFTGSVSGNASLSMWAAEAYSRVRLTCNDSCRMDFIGGYSHFAIDDMISISSTTITNATARTRIFNDLFEAENRFNGGQLGFEMVITRGRWMARSLTKVHLGNMHQRYRIVGTNSDVIAPAPPSFNTGGLLAMGNQGTFSRNEFSFAPEANFKLGYRVHKNALVSVGYTFIYWDNVALSGAVVDRLVDGTALNSAPPFPAHPAFDFKNSSLWVQGLDLGVVIDF